MANVLLLVNTETYKKPKHMYITMIELRITTPQRTMHKYNFRFKCTPQSSVLKIINADSRACVGLYDTAMSKGMALQ